MAAGAVLAAFVWQWATVHFNYEGNWTALFCTGESHAVPQELQSGTFRFKNSHGYDGQFFRYIARDPWMRGDTVQYVLTPTLRYRRILLPLTAWALALGNPGRIDGALIAAQLLFAGLGVFCFSALLEILGYPPWFGLGYLLLPATLISLDRQLADGPLLALTAAFFLLVAKEQVRAKRRPVLLWIVLCLAVFARETGIVLLAGYCLHRALKRDWRSMFQFAAAILPYLAWAAYVEIMAGRTPAAASVNHLRNFGFGKRSWLGVFTHLPPYPNLDPALGFVLRVLDLVCMFAVPCVGVAVLWLLWKRRDPAALAMGFLMAVIAGLAYQNFRDPYGYSRLISPALLYLVASGCEARRFWLLLPAIPITARVLAQLAPQAAGIARALSLF